MGANARIWVGGKIQEFTRVARETNMRVGKRKGRVKGKGALRKKGKKEQTNQKFN